MLRPTRLSTAVLLAASLALAPMVPARAQTPSLPPPPYNVDLGALITNALRLPGTVTSAVQQNLANRGVLCKLVETLSSGTPSTVFKIQSYDAASATWTDLATSTALTGGTQTNGVSALVYPGAVMTTTPTGWVLNSLPLPRAWRLSQTISAGLGAGATPSTTSKIGCNYLD